MSRVNFSLLSFNESAFVSGNDFAVNLLWIKVEIRNIALLAAIFHCSSSLKVYLYTKFGAIKIKNVCVHSSGAIGVDD